MSHFIDHEPRLLGLLAVVHRDGGHHAEKYGVEASAQAAMRKVATVYQAVDAVLPLLRDRFDGTTGGPLVEALEQTMRGVEE